MTLIMSSSLTNVPQLMIVSFQGHVLMLYDYSLKSCLVIGHCRPTPNHVDIVRFEPKGAFATLKCVYRVTRSAYLCSVRNFPPYPMWDFINTPPYRHNVLVVSHGIVGLNRQTSHTGLNKLLYRGQGSTLIPFETSRSQLCRYHPSWALIALNDVYKVERNSYIYNIENFLPYPMYDITNISHTDTTSSLCPIRL